MSILSNPQQVEAQTNADITPPTHCPACGAPYLSASLSVQGWKLRDFECGYAVNLQSGEMTHTCTRAFYAAVQLRSQLRQTQAERDAAQIDADHFMSRMRDETKNAHALRAQLASAQTSSSPRGAGKGGE